MTKLENSLRVGIIQTTVNETAWYDCGQLQNNMNREASDMVMEEIRRGFNEFFNLGKKAPRIVLIPEYSIPHSGIRKLEKMARAIDAVTIGGCDLFATNDTARNKGVIIVPNKWPAIEPAYTNTKKFFGKRFFTKPELNWFSKIGVRGVSENINYIIDADKFGKIGVAICADFYDIERFVIYRGRIHHLIIIAYNKDKHSFGFLAEAISRLLFCNVIICNTGHYGDSLAFSPYSREYRRIIYKNSGANISASQVIELPVKPLNDEQKEASNMFQNYTYNSKLKPEFKWPPGYKKHN